MAKTLIFVDLDNIYRGLLQHYGVEMLNQNPNLFDKVRQIEKNKENDILNIYSYADYSKIGVNTIQQKLQMDGIIPVFVTGAYKDFGRKNASDIKLVVDVVDKYYIYKDSVDNFVIVSADSDMTPIIQFLKEKEKNISLYLIDKQANNGFLEKFLSKDNIFKIEDILSLEIPKELNEDEVKVFLQNTIEYIIQREQYNIKANRSRVHQTLDGVKWNQLRYVNINGKRLCEKTFFQIITYGEKAGYFTLQGKYKEIVLNQNHPDIVKILPNN